jgi:hypothetical protein
MKFNVVLIFVAILIILGGFFYFRQIRPQTSNENTTNQNSGTDIEPSNITTIEVIANNGTLTPNEFAVPQSMNLRLQVQAVDKDYSFKVNGYPRLDFTMKKGDSTSLLIDALGVGEYTYTCGTNCKGTITVEPEAD